MKFKFPLQKVLDHRQTLEDLAQREFREAEAALRAEEARLRAMHDELHESRLEAGRVQGAGRADAPERLKQIHEFGVLQKLRIQRQTAKVGEAEKVVEEKREILRQKAIDLKMMERLKERRREDFLQEQRRREMKEMDEIAVLRFSADKPGFDPKDGE